MREQPGRARRLPTDPATSVVLSVGTGMPYRASGSRIRSTRWRRSLQWREAGSPDASPGPGGSVLELQDAKAPPCGGPASLESVAARSANAYAPSEIPARSRPAHRNRKQPGSRLALFRRLNGEFVFNWFINLTVSVEFFACGAKPVNLLNIL